MSCHIAMRIAPSVGGYAMHTVDYIVFGFLTACMLLAAAKALPDRIHEIRAA